MWFGNSRARLVVLATALAARAAYTAAQAPSTREIMTVLGRFAVGAVDVGDRFPPGCGIPPGPDCEKAGDGSQFVIVWLEPKDDDDLATRIRNADILTISSHVTLIARDGTRAERFSLGMREGRVFVAFATPSGARDFTLSWPGNPEIELGR